jgi:hypothetical protein
MRGYERGSAAGSSVITRNKNGAAKGAVFKMK